MSGFHDVRLPERFSAGSVFGPGFDVRTLTAIDSKQKFTRAMSPAGGLRIYDLRKGIVDLDDARELMEFFIARGGGEFDFRVKDWLDHATNTERRTFGTFTPITALDVDMVQLTTTTYQMVVRYTSGPTTVVRTITKPVNGTVKIGDGTMELFTGFTVDYSTGIVTFSADQSGNTPTWGGEFDVVAGFDQETSRHLQVGMQAISSGSIDSILCRESPVTNPVPQERPGGGATNHGDMEGINHKWSPLNGMVQTFQPAVGSLEIQLPVIDNMPGGGPHGVIFNDGSESLIIKDSNGDDVLNPFSVTDIREIYVSVGTGGAKAWQLI